MCLSFRAFKCDCVRVRGRLRAGGSGCVWQVECVRVFIGWRLAAQCPLVNVNPPEAPSCSCASCAQDF
eukprot:6173790-Pleurochrysis_carterae.AAC.1